MTTTFFEWLENCLAWFFPASLLADPLCALIIKGLEFIFGLWLLYILIWKPILFLFGVISNKIYGGH